MPSKDPNSPSIIFQQGSDEAETEESLQFYQAVGKSIAVWTRVEAELYYIYVAIAHPEGVPSAVSAAFHAIRGFRQRLSVVTELIRNTFYHHQHSELLAKWTKVRGTLNKVNKKRNKLAHGVVLTISDKKSSTSKTGWAPFLDLSAIVMRKAVKDNAPGLKSHEHLSLSQIAEITLKMSEAGRSVQNFRAHDLAIEMQLVKRTLIDFVSKDDPQNTTLPTPAEPPPPPESSQE